MTLGRYRAACGVVASVFLISGVVPDSGAGVGGREAGTSGQRQVVMEKCGDKTWSEEFSESVLARERCQYPPTVAAAPASNSHGRKHKP